MDRDWLTTIGGKELEKLVETALTQNQDLKAAAARLERSSAENRVSYSALLPRMDLASNAQRSRQSFIGFPNRSGENSSNLTSQFHLQLSSAWELDVWGRAKAGHEAAWASTEAVAYELKAAQISLAGQVAKLWLALAEANEQVILAEYALSAADLLTNAVRERYERALETSGGSSSQLRLTEVEKASRQAMLAQRNQEREQIIRQLEILLGNYPSGELVSQAKLPSFPSKVPQGLPSELLQRRPDILAAERYLASSGKTLKARKLARFPSLSLNGSGGASTEGLENLFKSSTSVWSLGAGLTQPIFQGGRLKAEVESAAASEREQIARLKQTVLQAFGEVEQALVAEKFLKERESAMQKAAELSEEAAQRAKEEYDAGTGDVLTLIDATKQKIDNASLHQTLRRLRLENRIQLHLALGGDFTRK